MRVNVFSLILIIFVGVHSFNLCIIRCGFITEKETANASTKSKVRAIWKVFAVCFSFVTLIEYFNYMWFPPSWKFEKPWTKCTFLCSLEGMNTRSVVFPFNSKSDFENCVIDWKIWLSL